MGNTATGPPYQLDFTFDKDSFEPFALILQIDSKGRTITSAKQCYAKGGFYSISRAMNEVKSGPAILLHRMVHTSGDKTGQPLEGKDSHRAILYIPPDADSTTVSQAEEAFEGLTRQLDISLLIRIRSLTRLNEIFGIREATCSIL